MSNSMNYEELDEFLSETDAATMSKPSIEQLKERVVQTAQVLTKYKQAFVLEIPFEKYCKPYHEHANVAEAEAAYLRAKENLISAVEDGEVRKQKMIEQDAFEKLDETGTIEAALNLMHVRDAMLKPDESRLSVLDNMGRELFPDMHENLRDRTQLGKHSVNNLAAQMGCTKNK